MLQIITATDPRIPQMQISPIHCPIGSFVADAVDEVGLLLDAFPVCK